jgi:hypothetical protein
VCTCVFLKNFDPFDKRRLDLTEDCPICDLKQARGRASPYAVYNNTYVVSQAPTTPSLVFPRYYTSHFYLFYTQRYPAFKNKVLNFCFICNSPQKLPSQLFHNVVGHLFKGSFIKSALRFLGSHTLQEPAPWTLLQIPVKRNLLWFRLPLKQPSSSCPSS